MYICNRSFTTSLQGSTLYQAWHGEQPDITHLREFGTPVWILLQGQKVAHKMLPKSVQNAYVRHDDGSNSVKYYSAKSRKILTSHNFCLLNTSCIDTPQSDNITLLPHDPTITCKGGLEDMCNNGKRKVEDPLEEQHRQLKSPQLTKSPWLTKDLPQQEPTTSRLAPHTQLNTPKTRQM